MFDRSLERVPGKPKKQARTYLRKASASIISRNLLKRFLCSLLRIFGLNFHDWLKRSFLLGSIETKMEA